MYIDHIVQYAFMGVLLCSTVMVVIKSESRPSVLLSDNLSLDLSPDNHRVPGYFATPATPVPHSHSLSIVMLFVQYKHSG